MCGRSLFTKVEKTKNKVSRIFNILIKKLKGEEKIKNEPLLDSWRDLANYGIIGMMVNQNKW